MTRTGQASPAAEGPLIRNCSVERTLGIVSDVWAFLILRELYLGSRRFEQIQAILELPRSTLSSRLTKLVNQGVLRRSQYCSAPVRFEYRLTEMGLDLYLVMLALLRFGDDWLGEGRAPPAELYHTACGHRCRPVTCCSACGQEITARDVSYRDGPGAGRSPVEEGPQRRRTGSADQFERGRPSSVSRVLKIIGDRWTFLVLREAFFGARRFDDIQQNLGVASNILADRLARLVTGGVFERHLYQDNPERFEYRLTSMGRALYLPLIEMLRFGDRWLGEEPPLVLTHKICGQDFHPVLACDHCHEPLSARTMRFKLNYQMDEERWPLAPAQIT